MAQVVRTDILKGKHGISKRKCDISFEKTAEEFLKWVKANKKPRTLKCYGEFGTQLAKFFHGKRRSQIHPFLLEKYKLKRLREGAKVSVNRELSVLKNIFNRMIE
jgi:hypothetical protein